MELKDPSIFAARRERLRAGMAKAGVPALLVSHAANRYYLSGFELFDSQCNETVGWLVVLPNGRDLLATDARFTDEAARLWPKEDTLIYGAGKHAALAKILKDRGVSVLGYDPGAVNVFDYEGLREHFELMPAAGLVEGLRRVKEPEEIERMRVSCALNQRIMRGLPVAIKPGQTEAEVSWLIEKTFREAGAEGLAFPSIVGAGKNAALPHAIPGATEIEADSLVLVDAGCRLDGYCSDQTRTFWVGENPSPRFQETKRIVMEAQKAGLAAIRPGAKFSDAYAAAYAVFEKAGVARMFTHSLGHGVGLETHEGPSLSPRAEGVFVPGMIITVEPGLYDPTWGGVRWEHMALVTPEGCETL